jgi:hypothetical protein
LGKIANGSLLLAHLAIMLAQQLKIIGKVFLKASRCSLSCLLF